MNAFRHHLGPPRVHDRWNPELAPALEIESGDEVAIDSMDSSGGQIRPDSTVADFSAMDRGRIHTITGPVFIRGAEPGDTLEIDILSVDHEGWGWSSITAGLGALPDRFPNPFLLIWKLDGDVTRSIPGVTVPLLPFLGIMGVCPPGFGERRTRPPGAFGGNLDVRDLVAGTKLYLPIFHRGALFSAGDGHAAQGNGEVCINGIEAPMRSALRLTVRKDFPIEQPLAEVPPSRPPASPDRGSWAFMASSEDPMSAMRDVVSRAIEFVVRTRGLSPQLAYVLCSVALDLRLSQVVNTPMVTVTGTLAKSLFEEV